MRVFRVENLDGIGPFWRGLRPQMDEALGIEEGQYHEGPRFPPPCLDPFITRYPQHGEYCGCQSIDQLLEWFPPATHVLLTEHDFKIVEFECAGHLVKTGERQVLFHRHASTLVERIPFNVSGQ